MAAQTIHVSWERSAQTVIGKSITAPMASASTNACRLRSAVKKLALRRQTTIEDRFLTAILPASRSVVSLNGAARLMTKNDEPMKTTIEEERPGRHAV
jgi:hypothetical protein